MGTNCTSEPLQASTNLTIGFTLPRARSTGFGSGARDWGPYSDPVPRLAVADIRFPCGSEDCPLSLATSTNSLPRGTKRTAQPRSSDLVRGARAPLLRPESFLESRAKLLPSSFRLFSPPLRDSFHLSLAILLRYQSRDVFRVRS